MRLVFETNDDLTIVEMVSGAWNIQDAHIVYQNYLLGKLYVLLYSLTKCVPWYGLIQYFFLWLSFSAIVIAGILLIFQECTAEIRSKKLLISGIILSCIGSMYRFEQFMACVALMSGLGISQIKKTERCF